MNRTALIASLLLVGCAKPPPEAPKELGELGAFLFANFETTDDDRLAEMGAGFLNLRDFLTKDVDLKLEPKENAVTMPILKGDDLGDLSIPKGVDPELQINRAVPGLSVHELDAARALHVESNQVCIESSSTLWAGRDFLTDDKCWANGSCDRLDTVTEVYKKNILAEVWYDQFKNYRYFEVEDEDGEIVPVIAGRAWIEKQFPAQGGGNNSWDQLFQLDVYIPNPDKGGETLRWFSMWSSITLGGLGDDAYGNLVVDGIDEAYTYGDEFIANKNNLEACTNDRAFEKPDRN